MTEKRKVNILAVDDREENLLALESWLSGPDLNVIKATSGNEALGLMLEYDIALVLLDVQMPDMDGFETAELMRGSDRTMRIPIIFVTAISTDQKHVFKGYKSGAVDYLFKPLDPHILKSKVNIFTELYQYKRSLENMNKELQAALSKVKTLSGLLPICANCKRIRDDKGYWSQVEAYIGKHTEAEFSHSICPECIKSLYPELCDEI